MGRLNLGKNVMFPHSDKLLGSDNKCYRLNKI